jgi:hypothetical protein
MSYLYKTLDEIKTMVADQGKITVTVMGERRWSAARARCVHEALAAESSAPLNAATGFFRTVYDHELDLSDASRMLFFTENWHLTCVFDDERERYAVYENTANGSEKAYRTILLEADRFSFADRLGVLATLPDMEKIVVQKDDATWRIKP